MKNFIEGVIEKLYFSPYKRTMAVFVVSLTLHSVVMLILHRTLYALAEQSNILITYSTAKTLLSYLFWGGLVLVLKITLLTSISDKKRFYRYNSHW